MEGLPKKKELGALISLLDEPDRHILEKIREKIYSYGIDAVPILEEAWENTLDGIIQQRIENIIHKLQLDNLYREINRWARMGAQDLLKGFILVTKHQYPDLDETAVYEQINRLKHDVWLELNDDLTPLEKVKVLNHIIYDVHKYSGNKDDLNAINSSHINKVLQVKKGSPLSLGIIYMVVAQKNDIPVYGVNLPQHFVLAYTGEMTTNIFGTPSSEKVLFYINPFNKGVVFTKSEIELFINKLNIDNDLSYYNPCNHLTIIQRLIHNLKLAYETAGQPDKVSELDLLISALQ